MEIVVTVGVNDVHHAELVRDDILEVVKTRTVIYGVTNPAIAKNPIYESQPAV